jgi:hypothetical protein
MSAMHRLLRRFLPRRFTVQLLVFATTIMVVAIMSYTTYAVRQEIHVEVENLVDGMDNTMNSLAVSSAGHLLVRDYGAIESLLLLAGRHPVRSSTPQANLPPRCSTSPAPCRRRGMWSAGSMPADNC